MGGLTEDSKVPLLDEKDFEVSSDIERKIWTPERLLSFFREELRTSDVAWFQGLSLLGRANYNSPSHVVAPEAFARHYEIIFVEKGQLVHWLDGRRHVLQSGDCFLIKPLQRHSTAERAEERGRFYWWIFSPEEGLLGLDKGRSAMLMESLCQAFANSEVIRLGPSRAKQLKNSLESLFAGWGKGNSEFSEHQILGWEQAILQLFFLILACEDHRRIGAPRGRRQKTQRDAQLHLQKICHYITLNAHENINLQLLTDLTPYSESHLLRLFRDEYGLPLRDYINQQKIVLAQKLLLNGDSVISIAAELNFSSSQYFAVAFRRYAGLSPTEWCRKAQQA